MSILNHFLLAAGLIATGDAAAAAAGTATAVAPAWAAEVDALVLQHMQSSGSPGAQIAVAENGRVVYAKAYGVADVESGRAVRNETLFQVGSVAKTYTGVLLAELASEGVVDLKAPIKRYVTELAGRRVGDVTAHDLLTHSAGWFDQAEPFGRTDGAAAGDILTKAPDSWVFGPPGRVFSYSNGGFAMAGYVAERAAGTPFTELMDARVLRKISRDHATYHPLVAMTRDFSLGHVAAPGGGMMVQRPMPANAAEYGAGFLYSTASDIARLGITLMSGGMLDGKRVLNRDGVARVTGGHIPIPGSPDNRSGYGLQVDRVGGEPVWRKSGNVNGYSTDLSMWPDRQLAVAVSINTLNATMPSDTTVRVAQIVGKVGRAAPRAPVVESDGSPAQRSAVAGRYSSGAGVIEIADRDGGLVWTGARGSFPMRFVATDRLLLKAPAPQGREFVVLRDAEGNAEFLHSRSRAWVRQRLVAPPPTDPPLDKSIVVLPRKAGIFVHERSRVGTVEVRNGVDADYGAPGKPGDPWVSVRVVPTGRVDEATSVAAQALALEQYMRSVGAFVDLQALPAVPIRVEAPGRGSLYANSKLGAKRGWTLPISVGSRQSFTYMDRDGQRTRHAGLVFHRHLADIEVRVRVAAEAMGQAEFDALADAAAREIVPAIDVRNFGRCPMPARDHNCAPDEASAPHAAPITGVQHALVFPLVPTPTGCHRDGVAVADCR